MTTPIGWFKDNIVGKTKNIADRIQKNSNNFADKVLKTFSNFDLPEIVPLSPEQLETIINITSGDLLDLVVNADPEDDVVGPAASLLAAWTRSLSGRTDEEFKSVLLTSNGVETLITAIASSEPLRAILAQTRSPVVTSPADTGEFTAVESIEPEVHDHMTTITAACFTGANGDIVRVCIESIDSLLLRSDVQTRSLFLALVRALKTDPELDSMEAEARLLQHIAASDPDATDALAESAMHINHLMRLEDLLRCIEERSGLVDRQRVESISELIQHVERAGCQLDKQLKSTQTEISSKESEISAVTRKTDTDRDRLLAEIDRINADIAASGLEALVSAKKAELDAIHADVIKVGSQKAAISVEIGELQAQRDAKLSELRRTITELDNSIVANGEVLNYLRALISFIEKLLSASNEAEEAKHLQSKLSKLNEQLYASIADAIVYASKYAASLSTSAEATKLLPIDDPVELRRLVKAFAMLLMECETFLAELPTPPSSAVVTVDKMREEFTKLRVSTKYEETPSPLHAPIVGDPDR